MKILIIILLVLIGFVYLSPYIIVFMIAVKAGIIIVLISIAILWFWKRQGNNQ